MISAPVRDDPKIVPSLRCETIGPAEQNEMLVRCAFDQVAAGKLGRAFQGLSATPRVLRELPAA